MNSLNEVNLIGHLGRDPEIRTFADGGMVCTVTLATTDRWRDKDTGELKDSTEWHRIVFKGKLAEKANNWLHKGSKIFVKGKLHTRKWVDKETGIERYATEVHAIGMLPLDKRPEGQNRQAEPDEPVQNAKGDEEFDDIPY